MRFTETKHGWLDNKTNLTWGPRSPKRMTWQEAQDWCKSLGAGWRMPTIEELTTLLDYGICDPATQSPCMKSNFYWSSTTYQLLPSFAWCVFFYDGLPTADNKPNNNYVRAVRGGT